MKIAISAAGPTLESDVDPRFGRCQHFVIADTDTNELEALDNASAMAAGGAGISAAQEIVSRAVKAVLTGNCGPNAYQVLSAAGIDVITGVSGKIKDAIEEYKLGSFTISKQANVGDHFGMGYSSSGSGMGMGIGRGMGGRMGMGRGMGRGMGMSGGMMSQLSAPQPLSTEQELEGLKAQSKMLAEQASEIQRRIQELENKNK
jgi:predicted Fe-Mo cluster-binding NifX family protein